MMALIILNLIFLSVFVNFSEAGKKYFATESCGHVRGPDDLTVIEFDKDIEYNTRKPSSEQDFGPPLELKNVEWECIIVVRGMPSANAKKYLGIQWRNFHVRDRDINTVEDTVEGCKKAYVTIYQGSDTTTYTNKYTTCGKDTAVSFYEWPGQYVTFKFYADFRRNESYTTTTVPTTTTEATCLDPGDVTGNVTTQLPLCTTPRGKRKNDVTTTPLDTYPYPEVNFRVDITSFDYDCNETIENEVLRCNESQRCLDESLKCDFWFSHNCKTSKYPEDMTDQTRDYPSFCFRKPTTTPTTTTTTEPPPVPFDWSPFAALGGAIVGLMLLCWCCWRPGYLPWRLARLRNVPFFNNQRCIVCCRGPTKCCPCLDCCSNYEELDEEYAASLVGRGGGGGLRHGGGFGNSVGFANGFAGGPAAFGLGGPGHLPGKAGKYYSPGSLYPNSMCQQHAPTRGLEVPVYPRQDPNNFANDWLKFIYSDGAHLREQR